VHLGSGAQDLNLSVDDELESEESWEPGQPGDEDPTNKGTIIHRQNSVARAIVQVRALSSGCVWGGEERGGWWVVAVVAVVAAVSCARLG